VALAAKQYFVLGGVDFVVRRSIIRAMWAGSGCSCDWLAE
jgi:hypothetical protein